ncbi:MULTISPECIES: fasciclin domain-containing protein [Roseomonadaceae]|uniref:Fasciclin domain-containing protein n=1 Tax=Falsiroseomonas oleicola TaxID=2801474 RepID=A0ABS6HGE5_9PROT|nr:fasciclin domain-containing protein [Roseomonas oleicola]MBU8546758.1 fasciclin domain-containing protein [Roseomonas oleicola]
MIARRHALGAGGLALLLAACQNVVPSRVLPEDGTIDLLTLLRGKPEHRRFAAALQVSGAVPRLGLRSGAVTLFAPVNEGFDGLPAPVLALLDNPPVNPTEAQRALVQPIVFANAAFGLLRFEDIAARRNTVVTWDRARLQVQPSGGRTASLTREGVTPVAGRAPTAITRGDVLAADGVFHVTNAPVLPG